MSYVVHVQHRTRTMSYAEHVRHRISMSYVRHVRHLNIRCRTGIRYRRSGVRHHMFSSYTTSYVLTCILYVLAYNIAYNVVYDVVHSIGFGEGFRGFKLHARLRRHRTLQLCMAMYCPISGGRSRQPLEAIAAALGSGGAADQGDHRAGGQACEGPPVDGEELISVEDLVGVEGERGQCTTRCRMLHVLHCMSCTFNIVYTYDIVGGKNPDAGMPGPGPSLTVTAGVTTAGQGPAAG
jgi:hypothetical protein